MARSIRAMRRQRVPRDSSAPPRRNMITPPQSPDYPEADDTPHTPPPKPLPPAVRALRLIFALLALLPPFLFRVGRGTRQTFRNLYRFLFAYLEGREGIAVWPPRVVAQTIELPAPSDAKRSDSLDAFRGLTILGMLLVNNMALDAATPSHLMHANWNHVVTFADVIFPWFLLIVGVALPLSWASHTRKGAAFTFYLRRVAGRTGALFLMGCFVDSTVSRQATLGLGVLQLIALAYAVGALAAPLRPRVRFSVALLFLAVHGGLLMFAPLDGDSAGRFTAAGSVVARWDKIFLVEHGLRGIFSLLPTGALVILGSIMGELLRRDTFVPVRKCLILGILGILFVGAGAAWSVELPFNKPLWTGSYILYTAGWGICILAAFYLLADVYRARHIVFPLLVPGTNAIFVYVASILVKVAILETWHVRRGDGTNPVLETAWQEGLYALFGRIGGGWIYTVLYIGMWWCVLLYLYHRRIFLRL